MLQGWTNFHFAVGYSQFFEQKTRLFETMLFTVEYILNVFKIESFSVRFWTLN